MNDVPKVMLMPVTKVWYEFVDVPVVGLEGTSWGEMQVSNDFVDANSTRNIASFFGLVLELV